ncbi:hypothetical protein [Methanocella arvoryzae]|nr:hypothetical protein [Methanocella arvoryzae]
MSGADVPFGGRAFGGSGGAAAGRGSTMAPVELIDIIFALSNVSLVREIVQENLNYLEGLRAVSKGQNEGLHAMIMDKQKQIYADLADVEQTFKVIVDQSATTAPQHQIHRNFNLNEKQSKALIYAISFSVSHLLKFIPGAGGGQGGSGVPGVII